MPIKCPKSVAVDDISYPYGEKTRFCPIRHSPCVLEIGDAEKCGVAGFLLYIRDVFSQIFENTCEIDSGRIARHELDVSMDVDLAAEKVVEAVCTDGALARFFN